MIGRPYQSGTLEAKLGVKFTADDRQSADRAFEALKERGLIRPTYGDLVNPELWVELTESGRDALERQTLDDLDTVLLTMGARFIELRAGAWEPVNSGRADALRQAAHSMRELIDQVLKEAAPDVEVKALADYVPNKSSRSGVTRRQRMRLLMKKFGTQSDSMLEIVEAACDLLSAVDATLIAASHARDTPSKQQVINALNAAEGALHAMLIR
jgi:hypothetical protein